MCLCSLHWVKNKNIGKLHKMSEQIVDLFARYFRCDPRLARSAYLVALNDQAIRTLPIQSKAEEIKRRVGLLLYYYEMYSIANQTSPDITRTQRDDIMNHINKVINDSPLENTSDQTLQTLLSLPPPQTGGHKWQTGGHKWQTGGRKWSMKYKRRINCSAPRGFSQRQYCKYGRNNKKTMRR
jgi:hypothetical protein